MLPSYTAGTVTRATATFTPRRKRVRKHGKSYNVLLLLLLLFIVIVEKRTFVVHADVVLRQPEVGELVFGVPAPGQRRVVLVHHRVQAFQPVLALLSERAATRSRSGRRAAAVGHRTACGRDAAATAVRTAYHGRVAAVRAGRHLHGRCPIRRAAAVTISQARAASCRRRRRGGVETAQ